VLIVVFRFYNIVCILTAAIENVYIKALVACEMQMLRKSGKNNRIAHTSKIDRGYT